MKRVVVIGAGGTIAMMGAHAFDWVDYGDTGIIRPVDEVLAATDLGLPGIEVVPHHFRVLPSTGITPADWLELTREIVAVGDVDGIVVTHGTASLEETAFFLSCLLEPGCPVVVTGAQRPPNTLGSDAVPGLRAAVAAAALAPAAVYVCMNGMLFDPARVTKTSNHALDAFVSPDGGPLGQVEADGGLSLQGHVVPRAFAFPLPGTLPRVDLCMSYAGADGAAVDAFVAAGAQGIISVGFPPGRATPGERGSMERAAATGVVVVQSSRATRGQVPRQAWNDKAGILSGGALAPNKARILLMLALSAGLPKPQIQSLLLDWGKLSLPGPAPKTGSSGKGNQHNEITGRGL